MINGIEIIQCGMWKLSICTSFLGPSPYYYITLWMGAKYCDVYICLSVRSHISENHTAKLLQMFFLLTVPVARSSSGGFAIRYVLPVLWMASFFHTVRCDVR